MTRARVMTYNIFMGGRKGSVLHGVIRDARTDVLLVNESPKQILLWKRQCRRLTDEWGMRLVAGGRPAGSNMIAAAPGVAVKSSGSEVLGSLCSSRGAASPGRSFGSAAVCWESSRAI